MKNLTDNIRIFWHDVLDSTNSEALRRIGSIDSLSVIAARCQSAGRGQRGNSWLARPGENLTFSLVLKFQEGQLKASSQMQLTALGTVVVRDYLRSKGIRAVIKWPNDIYAGDSKICGILIENGLSGEWITHSVIGIGINVNQRDFSPSIINPTSMAMLSGETYDIDAELEEICRRFSGMIPLLSSEELWEEYTTGLYRQGEVHDYTDCATLETIRGTIKGVRKDGRLIFTLTDGKCRYFAFKEISYII